MCGLRLRKKKWKRSQYGSPGNAYGYCRAVQRRPDALTRGPFTLERRHLGEGSVEAIRTETQEYGRYH